MEYHSNNNTHSDGSAAVNAASGSKNRKPATAQQLIRENVKYLIEQLEAGHSETLTAYLNAMANFHTYSFGNVLLIARQRPQATHVAGIRTWNELGRRVKRGEKGIAILAPMIGKRRKKENTDAGTEEGANQSTLLGFRRVFVWDRLSRDLWPSLCALDGSRQGPTSESPLDSSKHIIAQLLGPVQRSLMQGFQLSASFVHQSGF